MILTTNTLKTFERKMESIHIQTLRKLGIIMNFVKAIYSKPKANIILSVEIFTAISLKTGTR